jgi:hypothetical protein
MRKLLRSTTSGIVYVWTPQLAARPDMVLYEDEIPCENPVTNEPQPNTDTALVTAIENFRKEVTRKRKPKSETTA